MRQQAVELALKVDPSLARELAQDSVELEERKRLWLMIAKNAAFEGIQGGDVDVVSKVVSVLKDCGPDVLSIEDVSPHARKPIAGFLLFILIIFVFYVTGFAIFARLCSNRSNKGRNLRGVDVVLIQD
jgi:hypothetical protein